MAQHILFLRHFKTKIDPTIPARDWQLDQKGQDDMKKMLEEYDFSKISRIISSPEQKAMVTAKAIAQKFDLEFREEPLVKEVDRTKAGFIERDYDQAVKDYLISDNFSYAWEPRSSIQQRIKKALEKISDSDETILVISHGLYLSLMLAPYFEKDVVSFWKDLGFGQIITVDKKKLQELWN